MVKKSILKVVPAREGGSSHWIVMHDPQNPPDVFFDTNVWIGMNTNEMESLKKLQAKHGFRYRHSVTNYCELLSHLEDKPSSPCENPFVKYRQCFRKIVQLCHLEVLPSPEMEFLSMAGLGRYLDPVWIPDTNQTALAIQAVANADNLAELLEDSDTSQSAETPKYVIKPSHYRKLRDTDGSSFRKIMDLLNDVTPPIRGSDEEKLKKVFRWFMTLAYFFLLERPSLGRVQAKDLLPKERDDFMRVFTNGAGRLFNSHCVTIAKKQINQRRKIDPNDLYDALQLLCLRNENLLFVTNDRFFHYYQIDLEIQRVLPWCAFKSST